MVDDVKIIPPQGMSDESNLTPEEQKSKRLFEITGHKKMLKDLLVEELEKKRIADEKEYLKNNPKTIDDVPAFRGAIFSGKKQLNDREMASSVRRLTLKKIFALLLYEKDDMDAWEKDLFSKILVKLAGSVLPRIQEITGEDGEQLTIHISKEIAEKNAIGTVIESTKSMVDEEEYE